MWLRQLFSRRKLESELSEEIRAHIEEKVEELVAGGMPPKEAAATARREFGNVTLTERDGREVWRWALVENFFMDVRFGLRSMRKNPGFTAVAVLTLALGIGANTAIFSVVNAVLLRSLPFSRPSELVDLSARSTLFDFTNLGLSLPDIADVRANTHSYAALAAYQYSSKELAGEGKPERIESAEVSEDFFPVLGVQPLHGRTLTSSDMQMGSHVAVLSYALWKEKFGGDEGAIGKSMTLDGQPYSIVGVMPAMPQVGWVTDFKLWTAFQPSQEDLAARENHGIPVVARLKAGSSLAQAQKELDTLSAQLATAYPDADKGWSIHASSLKASLLGDSRTPLLILFCAVGLVLLIACANVSNLFLSRGWARRREFAIRSAMGATRGALLRQLGVECVMVALAGGVCAFLVAIWTVEGLRSILPPEIPRTQELRVDGTVAWFTLGASLLTAALSGLAPALLSSRQNVNSAIKESSGGTGAGGSGASHNFLRQLLVVGEVALAAVLLLGATLAVRSFGRLVSLDLGFRPDHLVTLKMDFPKFRFAKQEQAIAFVQQILDGTRAVPGVASASAGFVFPLSDEIAETAFETDKTAIGSPGARQTALANRVAPDFFRTLGIPLLAGRDFNSADTKGNTPVFVVNETLARKYFGSANVVGKRISTNKEAGHLVWGEIVGVAGNVREQDPGSESKPQVYSPFYQTQEATGAYLVVRTKSEPMMIVPAIEERIWAVDRSQPITTTETMDSRIAQVNASPRSQSLLLGIFGGLGFALALVGVYGVMSYVVSQRTREIGIRMALGAHPAKILRLVVVHGLKLTLMGVLIGVGCGLVLTRFLRSLLFGISASDPLTFVSVAVMLTLVALAACYIPARRAMSVDPMVALRYE
jgi:putative ABC transport system permease protein